MAPAPLRVALVHPFSWPEVRRGGERYLDDLAWYLARAGHQVDVLTGTEGPTSVRRDGSVTVRRLRHRTPTTLERRGLTDEEMFGALVFPHLLRRRWDAVHAFTPSAALAARLAGLRTLYTVLGHPDPSIHAHRPALGRLFRLAVRHSTSTVALSQASAHATERVFGRKVGVLAPGVRLDRFPCNPEPRDGPPRILFSAHFGDRRKRLDLALLAFSEVLRADPRARLQLSGAGDPDWAFERLGSDRARVVAATDLLGAGSLDEVPARYREATVTLLPSEGEAFGLAMVESLASGTPGVCTDDGGPSEIVSSPAVGRVARAGDADAVADAVAQALRLAADPATPARCATHVRRWDWDARIGPEHEVAYRELARR